MTEKDLKQALIDATLEACDLARKKLNCHITPEIRFDLKGTTAGLAYPFRDLLRYNIGLARDNFDKFVNRTCPHEVAHLVAYQHFGPDIKPHGKEWKYVMRQVMGADPSRCHDYDVSNHVTRRRFRYLYNCGCPEPVQIGPKHNKKIQNGHSRVYCRKCRQTIRANDFVKKIDIDAQIN